MNRQTMKFGDSLKAMKTMRTMFILLSCIGLYSSLVAQNVTVSGNVKDKKGEALPGVNIYIENSYDGTTSDENGNFSFKTSEKGNHKLMASFIGYQLWKRDIELNRDVRMEIVLSESTQTLDAVTITAGSFEASDKKRAAVLRPLDVYTTASSNGDINGALKTLPGTQVAADDGRLLVRGGDAYETKTLIDGMLASKPHYSKVPDLPTRGRFSPSLFSGTMFNTGGYSAEYGQALSSVLVLNSQDLATEDLTSISLMTLGGELSATKTWKRSSLAVSGSYVNLAPYYSMVKHHVDWVKPPESVSGTVIFRQKVNGSGLLKAFVTTEYGDSRFNVESGIPGKDMKIVNYGGTTYGNILYSDELSGKTILKVGAAITYDPEKIKLDDARVFTTEINIEPKISLVTNLSDGISMVYGVSDSYTSYKQEYSVYQADFNDHILAAFVEPEIKFTKYFGIRPGLRAEYSSLLGKWNLAPRIAMAVKSGKSGLLSASFGQFYQNPENDFLKMSHKLEFERANHYIASYQVGNNTERLFRAEAYYKTYHHLIRHTGSQYMPENISNTGNGYAGGIDLFFRDQKSVKGLDYWMSYSYIDSKRLSRTYKEKVTPSYLANHTYSLVSKYYIPKLNSQVGGTFMYASGRPFDDPNSNQYMGEKTPYYMDLSLNLSYLTNLWDNFTIVHFSMTNVLGRENVSGFRPTFTPNADGQYGMVPLKPDIKRFFFIGVFINIK